MSKGPKYAQYGSKIKKKKVKINCKAVANMQGNLSVRVPSKN